MSLLTIVQDVTQRLGINTPTAVAASADPQVIQLLALLNKTGKELASRTNWTALENEATFTTVATENQGLITTIAPNLKFIVNDTIWNRTLRRPVYGPLSPQVWQQRKALTIAGPWNQFRILGQQLKFVPAPTAGQICYFEYSTKAFATDSTGVTQKLTFAVDTDLGLLDEELLTMGLLWRWQQAKGLEFGPAQQEFEYSVANAISRDGSKPVLNMGDSYGDIEPVVLVPAGSW